ncbi:TerC family protein [Calditerrivibrio nitroreducens]|uniref:Integral membrane protein TerC n=1 Tax=Calditerrivibrio nitroreducens (strain DSM 19672 / NBRC 101217 / Yu37-1) TaxID=768670 RepID=E4TK24_CALNY|nr:TerC family protein [Calditerrivibrio nitroreducens]ADR19300.1 Integral membrane protein TerC [Calditerrivibrio nitroreducens DSM 19672]
MHHTIGWVIFSLVVIFLLVLDLGVFNKKAHVISIKEAVFTSAIWIAVAFAFNIGIYFFNGEQQAVEFLTGYIVEKALSVDNIFVMIMIFNVFQIPPQFQHKILFWGILGAIVMRGLMIFLGIALIEKFHWIFYIFGLLLIYSAVKMAFKKEDETIDFDSKWYIKLLKKLYPITSDRENGKFLITIDNKRHITPLLLALFTIEFTDLIFAIDSIPAIFAITTDSFIVFTSNIFAILGLRSLYFAVSGIVEIFHFLKYGLSIVLGYVGLKMILIDIIKIPTLLSLIIIIGVLSVSIFLSLILPKDKK